jgi:ribosome-associated protein
LSDPYARKEKPLLTLSSQERYHHSAHLAAIDSDQESMRLSSADILELVLSSLEDSKAENLVSIDLQGKTSLGDAMVIASGRSHRHVGAITDHLVKALKNAGCGSPRVEGLPNCDWVLIDTGDVIAHVFRPEVRDFYNLEKMWSADRPEEQN